MRAADQEGATVRETVQAAAAALEEAGIDAPLLEARLLVGQAAGLDRAGQIREAGRRLDDATLAVIRDRVRRRRAREPLAYLLGHREFWSLPFKVAPGSLVPRPETELLVEAALARIADRRVSITILDLGTGSGCILLALLHELPRAFGIGVDLSREALAIATANARMLGLADRCAWVQGDFASAIAGGPALVVSNPPYIPAADIATLQPEVRLFEPRLALDGGPDGLAAYRVLLPQIRARLAPGGHALLEFGAGQGPRLRALAEAAGFAVELLNDLAGHERVAVLRRSAPAAS